MQSSDVKIFAYIFNYFYFFIICFHMYIFIVRGSLIQISYGNISLNTLKGKIFSFDKFASLNYLTYRFSKIPECYKTFPKNFKFKKDL